MDAALFRIQAVPWTAAEEASVAKFINLLQVPVSKGLAARLKTDVQYSIHLSRQAVRGGLVGSWRRNVLEWRNALETYKRSSSASSSPRHQEDARAAAKALSGTIVGTCNSMFVLVRNASAAGDGVGDALIDCLVQNENFQQVYPVIDCQ